MAEILDGKLVAQTIKNSIAKEVESLKEKHKIVPTLAVIMVGNDPASTIYVNNKVKACREVGMASTVVQLSPKIFDDELIHQIQLLNNNENVNGILVQMPLPENLNARQVIYKIAPQKDVDCFHPVNIGNLEVGNYFFAPCTPCGIIKMLDFYNIIPEGKVAGVIGRSNIVGKPMAHLLLERNATVMTLHSKTVDLPSLSRQCDILVSAVGRPNFVTKEMVKDGAVVIDVGINRVNGKVVGDVKFDEVSEVASYITPVPGGVGPLTIATLLENTLNATKIQREIED